MKIFIDTNIFLDILLAKWENYEYAKKLLNNNHTFLTSDKVLLDIVYVWKKYQQLDIILEFIQSIVSSFEIYWWDNLDFDKILKCNDFSDFEDGFQYEIANKLWADFIITNNKKDFKNSQIWALTAKEFLEFNF